MRNIVIILFAVGFYCYRSPYFRKVDPVEYSLNLPAKLDGHLSPNELLDATERLHENALHWPESFAVLNNKIYTGLGDGRIVEVSGKKITDVTRIGSDCAGQHEEHICGRPLGMTFNKAGLLYVADAYHGIFTVDVKTGKKNNILPSKTVVDGLPLFLLNNIALDEKEQALYISQSSTKWNLSHVIVSFMEHESSGRLLKFDLKTKGVTVLLKDLSFPNGVELTHDGSAVLVAECFKNSIFKYFIQGPKKGTKTVLPVVFPGEPDNISRNKRGTYWVALAGARSLEKPSLGDNLAGKPLVRRAILYIHKVLTAPIANLMQYLPYDWAKDTAFELGTARIIADHIVDSGAVVEFDDNGKIIKFIHSPTGKVSHLSEALEHNGHLYLGSWRNHYIGKLKL
ncbi:adipocyte plasma membrane-associated protein [Parasteatoda tepidariorum]|uniref:adipocyte plasma membrane-associated protein n=1 Tax=Parasteatoda tepidariorum TaxID=114398 RepID=UPI001C71A384|nr:adipocyte plasma membrane-associated protein [Parasteatoda tepidariorum]